MPPGSPRGHEVGGEAPEAVAGGRGSGGELRGERGAGPGGLRSRNQCQRQWGATEAKQGTQRAVTEHGLVRGQGGCRGQEQGSEANPKCQWEKGGGPGGTRAMCPSHQAAPPFWGPRGCFCLPPPRPASAPTHRPRQPPSRSLSHCGARVTGRPGGGGLPTPAEASLALLSGCGRDAGDQGGREIPVGKGGSSSGSSSGSNSG